MDVGVRITRRALAVIAAGAMAGMLPGSTPAQAQKKGSISIKGSDTMVNFGGACAEAYRQESRAWRRPLFPRRA